MLDITKVVEQHEVEKRNFIKYHCTKQVKFFVNSKELTKSEKIVFLRILFPNYSLKQLEEVVVSVNEGEDLILAFNRAEGL